MILQTETVEQEINAGERGQFVKDVIAAREGAHPIAMVRKRRIDQPKARAALLLVHGFGQNRYTFHTSRRSFVNYLASAGFDVFNLDLRGRGRSRRYGALEDTTFDDYIHEDVPAAIRTVLRLVGSEQLFLVGHSMGGLISYCVAGTMREQVAGVVSIGAPYRFGQGSAFLRLVFAPLSPATASLAQTIIYQALTTWLGSLIRVDNVEATTTEPGRLDIVVTYLLRARGERRFLNVEVTV